MEEMLICHYFVFYWKNWNKLYLYKHVHNHDDEKGWISGEHLMQKKNETEKLISTAIKLIEVNIYKGFVCIYVYQYTNNHSDTND